MGYANKAFDMSTKIKNSPQNLQIDWHLTLSVMIEEAEKKNFQSFFFDCILIKFDFNSRQFEHQTAAFYHLVSFGNEQDFRLQL